MRARETVFKSRMDIIYVLEQCQAKDGLASMRCWQPL
jgi:hypothetical protein